MKTHHKSYFPLLIVGVLFLLIYLIGIKVPEETIKETIKNAGFLGILILIFLIWLTNIFAPLSASPFLFIGFYLFGQKVIIYAFIAAFAASITNFWIAKIWGKPLVEKLAGPDSLEKIDNLTKNYSFQALFILRAFLWQFHDIISYAFGLTQIQFMPYLIISTLGMIPGTMIWYYLFSKINNALIFIVLTQITAYAFLAIYIVWTKMVKK